MLKSKFARLITAAILAAIVAAFTGCAGRSRQPDPNLIPTAIISDSSARVLDPNQVPTEVTSDLSTRLIEMRVDRGNPVITTLQQLALADLIVEGVVTGKETRIISYHATESELAEIEASGHVPGVVYTDYEITIDKVLKGQAPSTAIIVTQEGGTYKDTTWFDPTNPLLQLGDKEILFLRDISGDPAQAPGQTKYMIVAPVGRFHIGKDNLLSFHLPESGNPVVDTYRGKDKSVLEKDIQDLLAKLPPGLAKEEVLQVALNGAHLVIEGKIQDVREVHFIPDEGKTQEWINQMLAEGKMPGLLLTDYTVTVDKVIFDKYVSNPRFFPNWKPLEPGQTIIVTRQGGTYKGVTKIEEPGPAFEIGSREILFLSGFSLTNYDVPDDGQARYSTDSRMGRFLIGPDNTLTAFTTKGLGEIYGGQDIGQLEQDIAEFLKTHPFNQDIPVPPRP